MMETVSAILKYCGGRANTKLPIGTKNEGWRSYAAVLQHLMEQGANPLARTPTDDTPLHSLARVKNLCAADQLALADLMCQFVHSSLDVMCIDPVDLVKRSPLHIAARNGTTGVAEALLLHGANIDLPESNGMTAMHEAARCGYLEMCGILIGHGANIGCRDSHGWTPLHYAASVASPETLQTLLAATNAGVTVQNNAGETPLHSICESLNMTPPPETKTLLRCCEVLLAQSERITAVTDKDLNNPLHTACSRYASIVANLNAKNKTPQEETAAAALVATASALVAHLAERCPNMLVQKNKRGKLPHQLLPSGDLNVLLKEQTESMTEQPTMIPVLLP